MNQDVLKQILKQYLELKWKYFGDDLYLCIMFQGEIITKVKFAQD